MCNIFESTIQKTNLWLKDVEGVMRTQERARSYAALRAVLHVLRDCMPVEAGAKFAAQMPLLVRGVYFDGWKPRRKPRRLAKSEFFRELRELLRGQAGLDPGLAARAVFCCLERHVSSGEIAAVKRVLSAEVRALWSELSRVGSESELVEVEPVSSERERGEELPSIDGGMSAAWQPGWAARQYGARSGGVTDVGLQNP